MKQIELIEIPMDKSILVIHHPKQAELYKDIVDPDFVESIRLHGVKQMPVLAPYEEIFNETFEERANYPTPEEVGIDPKYVIISGHRRLRAAYEAGLTSVTCELKHYDNYFDSEVDHIVYNKQRVKTNAEKHAEINAYKQKLYQVRNDLEKNGLKALEKYKSMNFQEYVKTDEEGRHYLPFARDLIEEELNIKKSLQDKLDVIFSKNWLQDKVDEIHFSKLSPKKKEKAINDFSKLVEDARIEVDKKDGLSVNKTYEEIMRVWKDIDSVINPKPKEKKTKKKSTTKVWIKPKDIVKEKIDREYYNDLLTQSHAEFNITGEVENGVLNAETGIALLIDDTEHYIYNLDENVGFKLDLTKFYQFLKEQF